MVFVLTAEAVTAIIQVLWYQTIKCERLNSSAEEDNFFIPVNSGTFSKYSANYSNDFMETLL